MASRSTLGDQRGFTIIEVLVAATLLVIGVLGTMAMVDSSNAETRLTGGRDGATNLAREVVEGARSIGYDQLQQGTGPTGLESKLQALPGLVSTSSTSWTVQRRGIMYTISAKLCSQDDPKDGIGPHAPPAYCAEQPITSPEPPDSQPEDFKRITVTVSWTRNSGTRDVTQAALIDSPGSKGPRVTALVATNASPAVAPKIITAGTMSVIFQATTPPGVDKVIYSLDGVDKGTLSVPPARTDWTFSIPVPLPPAANGLYDGGYDVSVRAVDARGTVGPDFTIPMTLIRSTPARPADLAGGPDTIYVGGVAKPVVELEWKANPERNVIGYRVYDPNNAVLPCPDRTNLGAQAPALQLSCVNTAATPGTYKVVALYRDASDPLMVSEGQPSTVTTDTTVPRAFSFKDTTAGNLTNCSLASARRDMEEGFPGLSSEALFPGSATGSPQTLNLCSPPFTAGEKLRAGSADIKVYFDNLEKTNRDCVVSGRLFNNATPITPVLSTTIPGSSPVTTIAGSMGTVSALTFAAGDRLNLQLSWAPSVGCAATRLHYGGTAYPSSLTVSSDRIGPPNAPTMLPATTLPNGNTQLSWSAPAYGNPISFYRIYRDGFDYTNRLDTTGDATETTYEDDPGGVTHTYYVTATSAKLAESPMSASVTK